MKASKFSDAQKAFILKQAEDGTAIAEVCRKAGISQATFFNWRKKYAGLMPSEMRRLKALEDENARLKRIVADLSLDKEMLQDVIKRTEGQRSKSSEACSQEGAGRRDADGLGRVDPPGVFGASVRSEDVPLQVSSAWAGRVGTAHQGDLRDMSRRRLACGLDIVACMSCFDGKAGT